MVTPFSNTEANENNEEHISLSFNIIQIIMNSLTLGTKLIIFKILYYMYKNINI